LFQGFQVLPITPAVAERAALLKRSHRLKLPDAVIWATALENGCVLVTRNAKDFPVKDASVRVPYKI
jgi:predicted nucleic acid-binding protein